ncbi:MAG: PilZ domain-containing protein [bacterium]
MDFREKRRCKRIGTIPPLKVEIYCADENLKGLKSKGEGVISLFISNISLGGIFLSSSIPFEVGATLHLNFEIPIADNPIHIVGKVVRNNFDDQNPMRRDDFDNQNVMLGVAIEFTKISYDDEKKLEEYINSKNSFVDKPTS